MFVQSRGGGGGRRGVKLALRARERVSEGCDSFSSVTEDVTSVLLYTSCKRKFSFAISFGTWFYRARSPPVHSSVTCDKLRGKCLSPC